MSVHVSSRKSGEDTMSGKPFHTDGVINLATGEETKDISVAEDS
jgi:hypothetical protein